MRTRGKPRWFLLLATVVALVALAAAGCGGGEESTPEPAAATTAETEAAAPATETDAAATTEAATETATEPAPEPASIKVALDWFPNPDHVSLYYALENGYWDEQALDVELQTPSDPSAGLKLVATGKFDLAIYYSADTYFAAEQGLPVVAVASLVPVPLNSLISLAGSKVTGPETVKGAKIGVAGLPFDDAVLKTIRDSQGLSEGDVQAVNVGFNLEPALLTKKVDAVIGAYFNIEATSIEIKEGEAPNVISMESLGVPTYDELLVVANKERLESDPAFADAVNRFIAGMKKGVEGAQADEAGSVQLMKDNTDYSAEEIDGMVPDTLALLTPPEGRTVTCFNLDNWQALSDWMVEKGLLKESIDATTVATNDHNPNGC
jgi:putative hydroxymethylpyrimidine transport system substrate-binding protein